MKKMEEISDEKFTQIIDTKMPIGLFYQFDTESGRYIGIDNSTGNAWVEDFKTLEECKKWLLTDPEQSPEKISLEELAAILWEHEARRNAAEWEEYEARKNKTSAARLKASAKYHAKLDRLCIRIPKGLNEKYKQFAKEKGKSLTAIIMELMDKEMQMHEKAKNLPK